MSMTQTESGLAEIGKAQIYYELTGAGEPLVMIHAAELEIPVLAVLGAQDIPYVLAAADYMVANIQSARKVIMEDAGHLCNLDHPAAFERDVRAFLDDQVR